MLDSLVRVTRRDVWCHFAGTKKNWFWQKDFLFSKNERGRWLFTPNRWHPRQKIPPAKGELSTERTNQAIPTSLGSKKKVFIKKNFLLQTVKRKFHKLDSLRFCYKSKTVKWRQKQHWTSRDEPPTPMILHLHDKRSKNIKKTTLPLLLNSF